MRRRLVNMKMIFMFIVFLSSMFIFSNKVDALTYGDVDKTTLHYEVNQFYIENGYIYIKGWAGLIGQYQHFNSNSTHSYSLVMTDVNNKYNVLTYEGTLLYTDKSRLYRLSEVTTRCSNSSTYANQHNCYYDYINVGFQFKIPLSDLEAGKQYTMKLRLEAKTVNRGFQIVLFAPSLNKYYDINGIRYELSSNVSTTNILIFADHLNVRTGPSTNYDVAYGWLYCSDTGYRLQWQQWAIFNTLIEVAKTNGDSYDSESWLRMAYNVGICVGGRSRAMPGYTYSNGYASAIYTDYSGTPAIIKVSKQNNTNIDGIKTYTAKANDEATVKISLRNTTNQTNTINVYQDDFLVYTTTKTFNNSIDVNAKYIIKKSGNIRVEVIEPSGYKNILQSKIYISSEESYTLDNSENNVFTITPEVPIMVLTDNQGKTTNYYETIRITVPYRKINLTSGKAIQTWSYIEYFPDTSEISLNNDMKAKVLFPTLENKLSYDTENDKYKVNMELTDYNAVQAVLNLPEYYLDKLTGDVYEKGQQPNNITTINGGRKWYTSTINELGEYDYQIVDYSLGVNKISIIIPCYYVTQKSLLGDFDSEYYVKRVKTPDELNYRFHLSYTYKQLLELLGGE